MEVMKRLVSPLVSGRKEKVIFETVHKRKDGTDYPVEVHLQTSFMGKRQVCVAIVLDITERKNYTEQLENTVEERTQQLREALQAEKKLNELKTKFLSLVSHEFKTPLPVFLPLHPCCPSIGRPNSKRRGTSIFPLSNPR